MPLNKKGRAASLFCCLVCLSCAPDTKFRGRFYWGHEVRSIQPCGSRSAYWVRGDDKTLQPLRERAERLRAQQGKPYPPLYVEVVGEIQTNSATEGFARDYDGLFNLREVKSVSDVVPRECR
jgi:putative lipoprotein